ASWLHRIAWRIAGHAKAAAARRRQIERQSARPAAQPGVDPERLILDTILHEELIRLPEKYRKPIVLCYLEGLTHEGAAEQLGWPVGTVRGRLSRARDLLRARLTRRGVTAPAVLAPTGWFPATSTAEAAVPAALRDTTVEVVLQVTSGQTIAAVVSTQVAALMEGAPGFMALSRWKTVASLLLLVGAIGVGSGLSMGRLSAIPQQSPQSPSPKDQATIPSKQTGIPSAEGKLPGSQPQAQARRDVTIEGTVVDEQGKPVDDAQVLFNALVPRGDRVESVEVRTKTDAAGRYRLTTPPLGGVNLNGAKVWAYRSGSAIAAGRWYQPPALVLRRPEPKTVKIEGPDGQPVVGARVSPRLILFAAAELTNVPDSLAAPRTVSTGSDGKAILNDLAAAHQLVAVRVTADSIGTQDFQLIERPLGAVRNVQGTTITIRLKPTSRLAGRVRNREGQPVANQAVEIWHNGGSALQGNPVGFKNGPLRTAADGSFQTPDNLLVGSSYRIVVRAPGMEPILSDWITIGDKPRVLLPMIQRPLRTISGRVLDRQGKPVLGVELFQAGDGPERTATRTAADGQFTLGGFISRGPVFLFARGEGFRFFGRMIKPGDGHVTVELTRTSERPAGEMKMLGDPIPLEESRVLAQRLLKPYWEALENKNESEKNLALRSLAMADPVGVLRKLEDIEFSNARAKSMIQNSIVGALARIDPIQAAAVAESIEGPFLRAIALERAVDALPERERNRKLALLDAAAVLATTDPISKTARAPISRFHRMGEVAERWYVLGEKAKAKTLLAEGLRLSNQTPRQQDNQEYLRGRFAARLARVDLPSALAIAKQFPASGRESTSWVLRNIAFHLAADNPAEAERVLRQIPPETVRDWFPPAIAWKMATVDP
ncbi:MAG TPA: sigma factor-like helix-turn-helix DNA-binding protein, partial [Isosphaeraceae bacterium]|nr:sigma factor-like helix-turn-helix DNA-binding protein [Isosphaeraceae bacterium]